MRLIDADLLKEEIESFGGLFLPNMVTVDLDRVMRAIDEAPTVDAVEVVHGEWLSAYEYALKIGVTDEERLEEAKKDKWWKFCNNCEQQVKGVRNYCPNCGAKMDGKVE